MRSSKEKGKIKDDSKPSEMRIAANSASPPTSRRSEWRSDNFYIFFSSVNNWTRGSRLTIVCPLWEEFLKAASLCSELMRLVVLGQSGFVVGHDGEE